MDTIGTHLQSLSLWNVEIIKITSLGTFSHSYTLSTSSLDEDNFLVYKYMVNYMYIYKRKIDLQMRKIHGYDSWEVVTRKIIATYSFD